MGRGQNVGYSQDRLETRDGGRPYDLPAFTEQFVLPDALKAQWTPEQRLAAAVLEQAVEYVQKRVAEATLYRDDALAWMQSEDDLDWPFSFVNVCYALGLEADAVRRRLFGSGRAGWRMG